MKIREKVLQLALVASVVLLGASAFAGSYNGVVYSTSKDIEPGKWFSNFSKVLEYSQANDVPMVVFWGSEGCGHCKKVENQMAKKGFTDWMQESGMVFAFAVDGVTPGSTATAKLYARYGSEFPYVGVYWKSHGVGGKAKQGQQNFSNGHFGGRIGESSYTKLINKINSYLKGWSAVKGGLFDVDDKNTTDGNRLEVSKETGTVLISLTRPTSAVNQEYEGDTIRITYADKTTATVTLPKWNKGDATLEYELNLDPAKLAAGQAVKLEMLNGTRVVSTSSVTVVSDENSAENPLWLGERTVAEPAKKGLLTVAAATPLQFGEWTMDLDVATQTVAKAEGKAYTLVGMLGSLWCHDCANTERNFLALTDGKDNLFAKWAREHNVALVSLDLPSVVDNDPEGKNSTCLLMKHAATTTLAYEGVYGYYDVSKGGAPQSLTEPMSRSGAGYMSRKGIKATEAAACLSNNLWLAKTNVDKGGYHIYFGKDDSGKGDVRNEDSNAYRPGVPGFVLLRKDGSVAARFQRFASASPMKFDAEKKDVAAANFANYIKRFDEMLEIADATDDPDDASEVNNYPSDASIPLTNGAPAGVSGRLCNADQWDSFRIVGMTGAAKQIAYVTGSSDAIVKAQFFIRKADGSVVPVGTEQKNPLSGGVSLTGDITDAGECFVVVSGYDITSPEFDAASSNSTFVGYTVTTWTEKLLPQEGTATIAATNGQEFALQVEADKYYRLVGVGTNVTGFAENFAETSTTNVYKAVSGGDKIVTAAADGDLTYQKWEPGTVRFVPPTAREITESDAVGVSVKVERTTGASGEVKLQIRVDRDATDCFYDLWPWKPGEPATYKQMPRFTVNDQWAIVTNETDFATTITYPDGLMTTDDVDTFVIKPNALAFKELQKSYYGDQKIVIRLKVLSGDGVKLEGKGGDAEAPDEATYVITIKDDAKQQKPGTVYFKEGSSIFPKTSPYTVYARKSSSVDISIGRTDPANGVVATEFTKSKGSKMVVTGVEDPENPLAGFQPLLARQGWGNRDISDKVITVTNLPAVGKSETITLKPVSPLKAKSSSTKAVKIVSVADDATEFEEREYCFSNLLRYVSCECACPLKVVGTGTLSAKKLRGSVPSGLKANLVTGEDGSVALVFSGYPTKAGTYTAYYQVVENRGTKKKPKNYGGLPVKVVFTVYDPVTAGKSADPAIAAIANPSVASTRTLNDLMVFGPYAATNRLAGKLKLTIPRTGKVSAKYVCNGGTISFSAKGWEPKDPYAGEVSGDLTATLTATKKAWTNYTLTVTAGTNGTVTASIADPYYEGTELEAWSDGKVWNSKHTAKPWKGQYTVSLMPAGAMVEVDGGTTMPLPGLISESIDGLAPRGPGYLTFKMTSSSAYNAGKMTWGGKLPDGTSVSGTTVLTEELADEEDEGDPDWKPTHAFLPVFTRFSTKVSKSVTTYDRLSLIARIVRDGKDCLRAVMPAESLARGEWEHRVTKPAAAAETMDFTMDVFAFGSFYDPNRSLGDCCEEKGPVAVNQELRFEKLDWMSSPGFFTPVEIDPIAITVKYTDKKPSKHTIKVNGGQANPRKVTLTLKRSTGVLSGSFKFPFSDGAGETHTVSAKWYGVLLPGWPCACGCGEAPEVLDPEVDPVYLPFISGGYIFSDTIPYTIDKGVSTKRGGRILSSEAGPQ